MAIVGFTGTRNGCTVPQAGFLELILRERLEAPGSVLHQGCCVGADAQAVAIARRLFAGDVMIVGHLVHDPLRAADREARRHHLPGRECRLRERSGGVWAIWLT